MDTIVVGAPAAFVPDGGVGAAYAFEKGSGWVDKTAGGGEVLPSSGVEAGDQYGSSIAIDGDLVVVGAPNDDTGAGSITIFDRSSGNWVASPTIPAPDGGNFGASVEVDGLAIVAGAPLTTGVNNNAGSFYLLAPDGTLDFALEASAVDQLGRSVALDGTTLLIVFLPGWLKVKSGMLPY